MPQEFAHVYARQASWDPEWIKSMEGHKIELRIDAHTVKDHELPGGRSKRCTDLQWYLGGAPVEGQHGTTLKLIGPDGVEVRGVFDRVKGVV